MLNKTEMPESDYKARMLAVADFIEANPAKFNMSQWDSCIAGFAARYVTGRSCLDSDEFARRFFGLDQFDAARLFTPSPERLGLVDHDEGTSHLRPISSYWAVATLRYLAMTGVVDWCKAKEGVFDFRKPAPAKRVAETVA